MKRKITLSLKYALMILTAESLSGESFPMSREARLRCNWPSAGWMYLDDYYRYKNQ